MIDTKATFLWDVGLINVWPTNSRSYFKMQTLMERNISLYLETLIWNAAVVKVQHPGQALKLY